MSNRRKFQRTTRPRLTIPARDLTLCTGQVLRYAGRHPRRPGVHGWMSGDGLTVTVFTQQTPDGPALVTGLFRATGYPSGHEIDAVTRAVYPDSADVQLRMDESPWVSMWAALDPPARHPMHARSA